MRTTTLRPVADSVEELVAGATRREPFDHADSMSGATLERVEIDGERFVLKHFDQAADWLLRATGDAGGRAVACWELGLYDAVAPSIDATVVGAARDPRRYGVGALLMRDVSPWLVPSGEDVIDLATHRGFIAHMAEQHATMWGWRDTVGLTPMANRYHMGSPALCEAELARTGNAGFQWALDEWRRLDGVRPTLAAAARALCADPWPLVGALAATPATFIQGDWKLGNLGRHPDGRTILIDWDRPGEGPGAFDLGWYLAVNCDRLPESKEATIEAYRAGLEANGVDTGGWFERQLDLCLLGAYVQLGWSKAAGNPDELAWWDAPCARALDLLG